jgi:hypothetical protein
MNISQFGNFLRRVVRNDSFRHGMAAMGAGAIIASIFEVVWPSA